MKNIFIVILLLGFNFNSNAQENEFKKVEYDFYLNLSSKPKNYSSTLYFNEYKSIFKWNNSILKRNVEEIDGTIFNIDFEVNDSIGTFNYKENKANNYSRTRYIDFDKNCKVLEEELPTIDWVILKETKRIGEFKVIKALGDFRGRKFEVWYTPDIPFNVGPWKLSGLPGLILQAQDLEKEVLFTAKLVNVNKFFKYDLDFMKSLNNQQCSKISLKEYKDIQNTLIDKITKRMTSKLPRGVKVSIESSSTNYLEKFN